MEVKVEEKNIISKPIASRPGTSASLNFRPFSGLLASENAVAAIRPKTVRFKPPPLEAENNGKSTLVYKPLAKLVSRTTVSLLANMGKSDTGNHQALAQVEAQVQTSNLISPKVIYNHSPSNLGNEFSPTSEADHKTADSPTENGENDQKSRPRTNTVTSDRPSYDGYNWRKYGQKQVKGSEYPRSYYRCTHPDCPVKKKVERSIDGEIAEIVYKGEHNHSKPSHIIRRNTLGEQAQSMLSNGTGQDLGSPLLNNQLSDRNEGEGFQVGSSSLLTNLGKAPACFDSCGVNGVYEEERQVLQEVEDHDQRRSKRRKKATQLKEEAVRYGDGATEHHTVVQNATDSETAGDGFRWRKYGQKVVKGNSYPRSYYRCTGHKCKVRKHIERASDDPNAFITTYEGKHNHDMPVKNTHGTTSETVRKT